MHSSPGILGSVPPTGDREVIAWSTGGLFSCFGIDRNQETILLLSFLGMLIL